ncbi:Lipoprotein-releasing system transmembrane protein LolE [subsurface metagenome]
MKVSKIAFRNIKRNKRRSILSGSAIAVATMMIVLMFSMINGMLIDIEWNVTSYVTGHVRVRNIEYDKNEMFNPLHLNIPGAEQRIREIDAIPEVSIVAPRITFPGMVYRGEDSYKMQGVGVDFTTELEFQNLAEHVVKGRIPEAGKNEALMGFGLADNMGLSIGDKFTVLTNTVYRGSNGMTFTVVGLVSFVISGMNTTTFMAPIDRVQRLVKANDAVTELLIKIPDGDNTKTAAAAVQAVLDKDGSSELLAKPFQELSFTYSWIEMAQGIYDVMALVFFILASSVIINTTMMVIFERMKEIGTIGAMGMTGGEIQKLFFLEAFYIGLIGALAGVILGIGLTIPFSITGIDLSGAMEGIDFDISNIIYPKLSLRSTLFVYIYSVAISSLATILPTRKAAHIEPVEALRSI